MGGYRDLTLFLIYTGARGLRIIGEVQIQDRALHELKLKVPSASPYLWKSHLSPCSPRS